MFWIVARVALRELRGSLMRSALTMLGVIIGVAAVVAMVALGEGAKRDIARNIENLGANLLIVRPGLMEKRHVRSATVQTLTMDDSVLIRDRVAAVVSVAPSAAQMGQVKYFNANTRTNIIGVTPDYLEARRFAVASGAFFTFRDVAAARRVAALGKSVADTLFNGRQPVGRVIKINGVNFLVAAVMAEKGQTGWWDADDQILIPLTTFQKRMFGRDYIDNIFIEAKSRAAMDEASERITSLLRRAHKIRADEKEDFHVRSQTEIMSSMREMTRTFSLLLAGIAAISLLVGGIGIMNIMLVTVAERTREIGLRKALGARRRDIMKQFLVESGLLASVGGVMGIALGFVAADFIGRFSEWDTYVSPMTVGIAYLTALCVGVFFGWYPARKAARMNPVDALRSE
ncbi:MAG: ABC transporter permease [Nitrospinae bacterium]|nr:ABC transporter permease [Nitrospinota bacterium]